MEKKTQKWYFKLVKIISCFEKYSMHIILKFFIKWCFILKLLQHSFLVHIFHLMSSFQKSIMNPLFKNNSSIFLNMIPIKVFARQKI
jgi:hypothetical protein